jgi:glycerophosphoryl diester phosphodiesterase
MLLARANGIHALEFDVHRTSDDQVVLHHDAVVVEGARALKIADTSLEGLRSVKPDLATMDQVLTEFPGVPMTVEVKARNAAEPATRKLAAETTERLVIVSSFKPLIVLSIKRHGAGLDTAPAWPTVILFCLLSRVGIPGPVGRRHVALQVPLRLDAVSVVKRIPCVRTLRLCDKRFVRAAHERGLAVHVWTLDEEADIVQALDAGADGIMSDKPTVLMNLLEGRGVSWSGEPAD